MTIRFIAERGMAPALLGGLLGILILHPYTMVVYRIQMQPEPLSGLDELWACLGHSFTPRMWPMSISFFIFCGAFGHIAGILWERKRELLRQQAENEQHRAVLEILREVTLTVAHYVRNANGPIGALATSLLARPSSASRLEENLQVIREESAHIEAIVASLERLDATAAKEEVGKTHLRMLDIKKAIQDHVASRSFVASSCPDPLSWRE